MVGRTKHRNLSKSVQGSANKYGTAPTVGCSSFARRLYVLRVVPSKTDARASAVASAAVVIAIVLSWSVKQILSLGSDASGGDYFGWSVALDGSRALVGAYGRGGKKGAAYIFDLSGGNWNERADISLGTVGVSGDYFGWSVALDGSRALVGAPNRDGNKGTAYIFDLSGGNWTEPADISLGS